MKKNFLFSLFIILTVSLFAQVQKPVKWKFEQRQTETGKPELVFTAQIEDKWHIYGLTLPEDGPIPTSFNFEKVADVKLEGGVISKQKPEIKNDPGFGIDVSMFSGKAVFVQKFAITGKNPVIKGYVEYMSCNDVNCLPPVREEFEITPKTESQQKVQEQNNEVKPAFTELSNKDSLENKEEILPVGNNITPQAEAKSQGWIVFLLIAFFAGLAGVLTPCVFPMIPMTVSFFMNNGERRANGIIKALIFGLSLVFIYTLIGGLVSLIGSGFVDFLTKHWIPNLIFFLLFVIFSLSFLGWFEIVLPGTIVNKADQQVEKGGMLASFFMALTTALVSFSCTGPIVGSLLVEGASGGVLRPTLGMLSFGVGFALPFTVLALFPSLLKNLPKSGGWMNAVKVVLGLIMLAFSLKFILNIDQTRHLGIISRDVYIVIWMVIFIIMGFYLLGKIRMTHDSETKTIGIGRLLLAIIAFSFAGYLFTGLLGSPLKNISSFLPPQKQSEWSFIKDEGKKSNNELCGTPAYSDMLEMPLGLNGYFDYKEGVECARKLGKPVLLDFKGHTCSNCKKMENTVWSDPAILNRLKNDFVIIALYTDDYTVLPENKWIKSSFDGKTKKTMGEINADFQITQFKTNTVPMYVVLDNNGNTLSAPVGYSPDISRFGSFLDKGIHEYKNIK